MDDIEDMVGAEGLARTVATAPRAGIVAPKRSRDEQELEDASLSVPGTQRIWLKTYGCAHNVSDSEYMHGVLASYGFRFTQDANEAQLWLLTSCTVKDPSQAAFMHLVAKGRSQGKAVVVAGCVPQADRHLKGLEGVSVVGTQQLARVVEVVEEALKGHTVRLLARHRLPTLDLPKIRRNPMVEVLPLSTGCLGACTYCKTRHARGALGSYAPAAIVARAQSAVAEGVTELWLASEDTGAYGADLGTDLPALLRALLAALPAGVMLRVGMTNPPHMRAHLDAIAAVLNHDAVYSFLHVPVQAGSDRVLQAMHREYAVRDFCAVADALLAAVPGLALATDVICGFPGEADDDFAQTAALVARYRFSVLNISQFYPRPGTPAAKMPRVPTQVVKTRSRQLTKLFESFDPYPALVDTTQKVWINTEVSDDGRFTVAHTKNYTKVLLQRDDSLMGCTAQVAITASSRFHVSGTVVSRSEPVTAAAAALRAEILARRGNMHVSELFAEAAATSASCGSCEEDLEDTCSSSSGGCSSGSSGCGGSSSGSGCSDGKSGKKSGCCGGAGGSGCCSSSGSKSKHKKKKTNAPQRRPPSGVAAKSKHAQPAKRPAAPWSMGDRLRQLAEDKVALAAMATLVASTVLVTTRLLILARK
ncbi:hypothetical protein PybrP1_009486 [[Pythium] brassicae (nom. inval.)]|nr:hypothetical protein PybrP1_009486 [[Pythium] brassicae (nom. inval.)]